MQSDWLAQIIASLRQDKPIARLVILSAKGSTPRAAGATLNITQEGQSGSIGGGALEYQATHIAREALTDLPASGFVRFVRTFALGPDLGQCCGGNLQVLFECFAPAALAHLAALQLAAPQAYRHDLNSQKIATPYQDDMMGQSFLYDKASSTLIMAAKTALTPLYIYGAGHVGRALIDVTNALAVERIWVDSAPSRFPEVAPADVTIAPAKDMTQIAAHAPEGAYHIIVTYSHQFDEAITHRLLAKGVFGKIGLIGSVTKKARFAKRFLAAGIAQDAIDRVQCPVGLPDVRGKAPAHVALSIAGQIAVWLEEGGYEGRLANKARADLS